jgi:8-hydroxy-5-deazaflavin:NADPH oxidoreductase
MKIAFIGVGNVGAPLAVRLQLLGHQVMIAARDSQSPKVQAAINRNSNLLVQSPLEAVTASDIVFLATPFSAIESALNPLKSVLNNKILVDCTNPVGANLTHSLQSQISGSETSRLWRSQTCDVNCR